MSLPAEILKTIGAVFCAPAKIGSVMKGNRSGSHLLLKYRLSHLIKFLSIHSLALILQFLIKKGRLDQRHFPRSPQVDLGNYSQAGSAEKKCEENGAGGEKKEGEEEQTSASEKTKVRRIICPGASHITKFRRT